MACTRNNINSAYDLSFRNGVTPYLLIESIKENAGLAGLGDIALSYCYLDTGFGLERAIVRNLSREEIKEANAPYTVLVEIMFWLTPQQRVDFRKQKGDKKHNELERYSDEQAYTRVSLNVREEGAEKVTPRVIDLVKSALNCE